MGARIEISVTVSFAPLAVVAPLVGARIEIGYQSRDKLYRMSLPSWERGLKCVWKISYIVDSNVAPLVGARIEIKDILVSFQLHRSRSPRGSAD